MSDIRKHLIENEKKDREKMFQNDSVLTQFLYLETILELRASALTLRIPVVVRHVLRTRLRFPENQAYDISQD